MWFAVLAVFVVTSLFEGYTALPGMQGHSIFSVLARPLVVALPLLTAWALWRGRRPGWLPLAVLTAWLGVAVATFLAFSPRIYYDEYYLWSQIGGYALVLALWTLGWNRTAFRTTVILAVGLYVTATIAVGLWETATGLHLGAARSNGFIPTTFYFDANSLGAAIALILPFVGLWLMVSPKRRTALVVALLVLPLLYLLYKTGSRGGELALLVDLAVMPAVIPSRLRRWGWALLAGGVTILAAGVLMLHALPANAPLPFALKKVQHLADIFTRFHLPSPDAKPTSLSIRMALLQSGLEAMRQHPFGLGPRGAERWYAYWLHHPSPYNTYGVIDAHNMWLENGIDFGWIGLALYLVWYLLLLVAAFRLSRRAGDPFLRYLGAAAATALTGFLVGSLSPSSVMIGFHVMWVVYGIVVGAVVADAIAPRTPSSPASPKAVPR
ncbi:MAG: O-antigen ligase family protein [Thermaerobacter sp.]|nr:O-antigen ligase family protein [Thermaerobacter sp.]